MSNPQSTAEVIESVCPRLCIDDMCRGNPGNTLCGGCYCPVCHDPNYEEGECDDCRPSDYDDDYEGML